jgi:glycosyltransferase involved in cell wall biosynthesis
MKIFMHAPEESGCTYYRNMLPQLHCYRELAKAGIELVVRKDILQVETAEVFILQRVIQDTFLPHFMKLKDAGVKQIFQTDDDLWNLPLWNPAITKLSFVDRNATTLAMDYVDGIITSTQPLADVIDKKDKTTVLPNFIDPVAFHKKSEAFPYKLNDDQVVILWAGSSSHDGDLTQIVNPVVRLIEKYGNKVQFVFFGYLPTELAEFVRMPGQEVAHLKPRYEGNILFIPGVPIRMYHEVLMAIKPDIGIAPIADCLFNYSKSNIKYLEMTLAGASFIGSDLPPYQGIEQDCGKLIAPDDEQGWFDALDEFIEDESLRKMMRENALEDVLTNHTWQAKKSIWLNYFLSLKG